VTAYLLMALLLLAACAWLTRPYWRGGASRRLRRKAANVAVYRSRLAELETEVETGVIDADSAQQLRQELGAHLLQDAEATPEAGAPAAAPAPRSRGAAGLMALVLAGFAAGFYFVQGSWRTQTLIETAQKDPQAARTMAVDGMVQKLAERLEAQPEDSEGWVMLGRSYFMLERFGEAARAYAEANRRVTPPDPELLVSEGEALALARDRDLLGRPRQLFEQALALSPDSGKALWYAGLAAAQAEDYRAARTHWLRLRQQELPPELVAALDERLQDVATVLDEPTPAPAAAPAKVAAPAAQAPAAASAAGPELRVQVSLAPALAAKTPPGRTLFVFAKAADGPPMPLAVQRLDGAQLPLEVRLDESMGMMPQLKLSQFDRWVVTARITASGSVKAEAGDWEGSRPVSRVESAQPLRLVIDRVIP